MKHNVFFSFHYTDDNWRAAQVRNMNVVEGNQSLHDNDWEAITRGGDVSIQRWIDNQLYGKSCTIVLIGQYTAGRKWINYEIEKSWSDGKALLGIHIHNLKDRNGYQANKGVNPFALNYGDANFTPLSSLVKVYDPPYSSSESVYSYIKENIELWVDAAITLINTKRSFG